MLSSYRQVLRLPSYRWFWLGFSGSVLGDALSRVALTWYVYEQTQSAAALGTLTLAYTGPVLIGGLAAGWLLDRFDRRRVLLVDNVVRAAAMLVIPLLHALGALALWHVYAVAAVYGLLMMVPLAGSPALVPDLVPREQLATANALETLSFTLGGVIGPPLAGLLIAWIGAPNVVLLDALSYGGFALALTRVRVPAVAPAARGQARGGLRDAARLLLGHRVLLATTLMFSCFNLGFGALLVWLPLFADGVLRGGPALYGALLGCIAVGEVVSAALAGGWAGSARLSLGTLICLAQILAGASLALLLVPSPAAAVVGLGLFGLFSAPLTIWAQTLRMRVIPEALRGRTFALLRTLMQGGGPLGGVLAGAAVPALGLPVVLGLAVLVVGGPGVIGLRVRELRGGEDG
jgi:MFS family permease